MAQRPLALLLDDLHWADPASLDLLRSLARQLAALPLLLVATYRADELTRRHPLAQLLPLLVREARAATLELPALPDEAVRALAEATEPRQPLALLAAHRLLGGLHTEAGLHAEAQDHLDRALALADACAAPYERALTLLALAELRAATGQPQEARPLLDEVRRLCEPLQARPTLARTEALAARLATAQPPPAERPAARSGAEEQSSPA